MVEVRRRRAVLLAAAAVLAAVAFAAGVLAGRGAPGSSDAAPARRTLALVPADALVAVHVSTDRRRRAVVDAARTAGGFPGWPGLRRGLLRRLRAPGCGIDLRRRPGDETTLAILPAGRGGSASLLLTDAPASELGDVPRPCGALVARRVDGIVAIGEPAAVARAQAVADGRAAGLVDRPVYRAAARDLPAARVVDAWASPAGLRGLLAPLGGTVGTVAGLVDGPGLRGAVAALAPAPQGAALTVRRIARAGGAPPRFVPTLQRAAPEDALAYLASGDLTSALGRVLGLLAPAQGADLRALADAGNGALRTLADQGREAAIVIAPSPEGPALTLLARVRDAPRARRALRGLEAPLGALLGLPAGARWADARPAGVAARVVRGGAGRTLAWAVTNGGVLALSTSTTGLAPLAAGARALAGTAAFRQAVGAPRNLRNPISSLVFLDPNQLLRLGDDGSSGAFGTGSGIRRDLARVRAIGARTIGGGTASTVNLSLWIP